VSIGDCAVPTGKSPRPVNCVKASPRSAKNASGTLTVDLPAVADLDHDHDHANIFNPAQNSIVPNAIPPITRQRPAQGMSSLSRVRPSLKPPKQEVQNAIPISSG